MGQSFAISPFTMPAALAAADSFLGGEPSWAGSPNKPEQLAWLDSFRRRARLAATMPTIDSHATTSPADHATWLKGKGWDAQITQGTPRDVFLAAVLDVVAKWKAVGQAYEKDGIHRVVLNEGVREMVRSLPGDRTTVEILTQGDYSFRLRQVDTAPTDAEELAACAAVIARQSGSAEAHVDFPMIDLACRSGAEYMLGLRAGDSVVTQAAEQFTLAMDERGGRARAAAEVALTRSLGPRTIKIDGPFVAVVRSASAPAGDQVVFAAYCARDSWKRPTPLV